MRAEHPLRPGGDLPDPERVALVDLPAEDPLIELRGPFRVAGEDLELPDRVGRARSRTERWTAAVAPEDDAARGVVPDRPLEGLRVQLAGAGDVQPSPVAHLQQPEAEEPLEHDVDRVRGRVQHLGQEAASRRGSRRCG